MGSFDGHITEDLLVRYLLEECDVAERAQVEEWINVDKANREEFYALKKAWDISAGGKVLPDVDVSAAWQNVSEKTQGGGGQVIELDTKRRFLWAYAVAAVAVVLIGLFFLSRPNDAPFELQFIATTEFVSQKFADSSLVVLSPNSKATVHIGKDSRQVLLEGKAYFEVQPMRESQFLVHTENVWVTVIGTAFTVEETEFGVRTEVREGKVRMSIDGASIKLEAGDVGLYNEKAGSLHVAVKSEVQTWGDKTIEFSGAPLGEVIEHLKVFYPVDIVLSNEQLVNCPLTATFSDEEISDVLQVIASTFGLELKQISNNAFELDGEGC